MLFVEKNVLGKINPILDRYRIPIYRSNISHFHIGFATETNIGFV
jgi:hypothetical protein